MKKMMRFVTACLCVAALGNAFADVQPMIDSEGHEFVLIPAGEFMMGGQDIASEVVGQFAQPKVAATALADEYPSHKVRISKPFFLSRYEVTVGQFRRFTESTGYLTEAEVDGTGGWGYNIHTKKSEGRRSYFSWRDTGYPQTDEHPVVNVSYHDAMAYLKWLRDKENRNYRLPTEAEWEYANRAGSQMLYANTNDPKQLPRYARALDLSRHTDFGHVQDLEIEPDDPSAFPTKVGSLSPNAWGLFDINGNVWEWVSDWYGEDYYAQSPVDDPKGPLSGDVRVRRGGGWNSFPVWLRSSFRNINTPSSRCLNLGFRVARDL